MNQQDFVKAGFTVIDGSDTSNPLLSYLKEHYPSVIRDNEINLNELKSILGLPVDDKVNGYGLNFIGRNFARAKYSQETDKALSLNTAMSKNIDTTQNLVLKGDNLDSLKILKNYYKGQIKCIYIDPPYNTDKDEFVYPDKFDKEEAEILGLVNLSEDDFARLDFSFKTKKSHNGWLSFMYPRLLLAQELLSDDGVIFISIDDNEQANLKLLCDDIFGDESYLNTLTIKVRYESKTLVEDMLFQKATETVFLYAKNASKTSLKRTKVDYSLEKFEWEIIETTDTPEKIELDGKIVEIFKNGQYRIEKIAPSLTGLKEIWASGKILDGNSSGRFFRDFLAHRKEQDGLGTLYKVSGIGDDNLGYRYFTGAKQKTATKGKYYQGVPKDVADNLENKQKEMPITTYYDLSDSFGNCSHEGGITFRGGKKPLALLDILFGMINLNTNDTILDFFAGSGTTGHAVMQLNAEDGGNRKFILCQIDEPIDPVKKKDEYKFCIDNNLPPVISSITIERLNRAGEAIKAEIEKYNAKKNLAESDKKQLPDIGYKVFDSVSAPKLAVDDKGQIAFPELHSDAISRIYNMIFKVGIDEPSQVPTPVIPDCMYQLGDNYYITDSHKVSEEMLLNALKDGTVYIDGWTASLDVTLQSQKDKVKIVF